MNRPLMRALALGATLALTTLARADAPTGNGATKVQKAPAPVTTPAHHKTKCCAGRAQAQPKPPEPTK
jgi:hypothetical protein